MALFSATDWNAVFRNGAASILNPKTWIRPLVSKVTSEIEQEIAEFDRDILEAEADFLQAAGEVKFAEDQAAAIKYMEKCKGGLEKLKDGRASLVAQLDGVKLKQDVDHYNANCTERDTAAQRDLGLLERLLSAAVFADEKTNEHAQAQAAVELAAREAYGSIGHNPDLKQIYPVWPAKAYAELLTKYAPIDPAKGWGGRLVAPGGNEHITDVGSIRPYHEYIQELLDWAQIEFAKAADARAANHPKKRGRK
jgi:hypothetical protein